jgi:beta-lactamase regulating signal transducer with metallopeptidase domain
MQVVAQAAVEAIASCLILGMAVTAVAWILTEVLPPGRAGLRFAVWFSALAAIGLLPLLQNVLRTREPAGAGFTLAKHGLILLSPDWAAYLLWPWALVALCGLLRVAVSAWHLHQVGSAGTPLDPAQLAPPVRETVVRAAQVRPFEVRVSQQLPVPVAIGLFRPAVVLPQRLLQELSVDQLNQVLLHESTHLLRYDDWTNLLQKIARAVLFFHPAVWWLENRLTLEREMACDEAVVAKTCNPRAYAECLALLAEKSVVARGLALVQAAVGRLQHTSLRVKGLLETGKDSREHRWGAAVAVVGVFACSAMLLQVPDLVGFRSPKLASRGSRMEIATQALAGSGVAPELVAKANPAARLAPGTPQVVPATFVKPAVVKPAVSTRPFRAGSEVKARREAGDLELALFSPASAVTAPTAHLAELVPVSITTVVLVENDGGPEPVWRLWRVTMIYTAFYPAAEQNVPQISRKI